MIVPVRNGHVPIAGERQAWWELELALLIALASKPREKRAVGPENLNPVVVEISHDHEALGIDCDARRFVELAIPSAFRAEPEFVDSVAAELDHAVVIRVGYQEATVFRRGHVTWVVQATVCVAEGAVSLEEGAVHFEELQSVVFLVHDYQVAFPGQCQAGRVAEFTFLGPCDV